MPLFYFSDFCSTFGYNVKRKSVNCELGCEMGENSGLIPIVIVIVIVIMSHFMPLFFSKVAP